MNQRLVYQLNIEAYSEIMELAIQHGKKPGDSMEEEFKEVLARRGDQIRLLGSTDKDIDLLAGDFREEGFKILNLKEIERKSDES